MEEIDSYLKDLEGKVKLEVFNLLNEVKTSKDEIAYKNLNDLYSIPELKDENIKITYYPCLQLEILKPTTVYRTPCRFFTSEFKLPPNEFVIKVNIKIIVEPRDSNETRTEHLCQILTNCGRMFNTQNSIYYRGPPGSCSPDCKSYYKPLKNNIEILRCSNNGSGDQFSYSDNPIEIVQLESLPYKLPIWCFDSFNSINSENQPQLQNICRDVFNIIGRWREHVSENINLDTEKMIKEITEQKNTILTLNEQIEKLQQIKEKQKISIEILDKRIEIFESKEKIQIKNEEYIKEFNKFISNFLSEDEDTEMYLIDDKVQSLKDFIEDHSFIDKNEYQIYQTHKKEFLQYIEYKKLKKKFK